MQIEASFTRLRKPSITLDMTILTMEATLLVQKNTKELQSRMVGMHR